MAKKKTSRKKKSPPRRRAKFTERWDYPDDANPFFAYLDGYGAASRRTMESALRSIADVFSDGKVSPDELAWHLLRSQHLAALRGRLVELHAPATTNRYLATLRGVLKSAWRLGLLDRETLERTVDVLPVRGKRNPRGRGVAPDELAAVFRACLDDPNEALGLRDAAMLALLYGTGMRRAEAAGLVMKDFDPIEGRLSVVGKGSKERDVYVAGGPLTALSSWLEIRGEGPGPIFRRISKLGDVLESGIGPQLVYHVVNKRHLEAGVEPFTPHDLRRSCISELLDDNVDIATVAKLVGHSNVQTTAKYDRRSADARKAAVMKLRVPYPG